MKLKVKKDGTFKVKVKGLKVATVCESFQIVIFEEGVKKKIRNKVLNYIADLNLHYYE
jgi:hypothetical protein